MLETEHRSGATVLRLKHGKVNALDTELLRAITAAMQDQDPAAAVVITGHGSAFSAGVDLKRIVDGGQAYVREFLPALTQTFLAVFDHPARWWPPSTATRSRAAVCSRRPATSA